ncbi:MAG TPA: ABC transporter permease [Ignavibacteriaceae bacterium]|nr:ABC transporter permease [Ignavibacteriaceae bacterium]
MSYESYISKRYLLSKHKINFITIISLISILGITVGVAALIVVLSVFNGFGSLVKSFLMNMDPHVRVEIISKQGFAKQQEIPSALKSIPDVKYYAPFVSGKVLAYNGGNTQVVNLKGIKQENGNELYQIRPNMLFGKYDLSDQYGIPHIILGLTLADRLESVVGDTITVISPVGIEQAITQFSMPVTQTFVVSGIYSSNNNDYDANFIFCNLSTGQDLLGYNNNVQGYDVRLNNISEANKVKSILNSKLNSKYFNVNTWYDFHKELYIVMNIERWTAYILLCLIIAVASFNTLGSLSMSVIEKKRDIGILRSMGSSENSIMKIFMYEGLLIGVIGTISGLLLGYLVCYLQIHYNIYPLDPTRYKIDSLPLKIKFSDFLYVSGASMALSFIASLIPAKRAAKVNPLEAIKWE